MPAATFALRRVHLIVAGLALALVVAGLTVVRSEFGGFEDGALTLTVVALAAVVLAAPALLVLRARPLLLAGRPAHRLPCPRGDRAAERRACRG